MSPQTKLTRRQCVQTALVSSFLIGNQWVLATPREAKSRKFVPTVLKPPLILVLEQLSETLVPGSTDAGIAAYIDSQLSRGSESLLMAKYLNVTPLQQTDFYATAINNTAIALKNSKSTMQALVEKMFNDSVDGWQGAPASFFLFLLRADGLDVTYGTETGAEQLGIPYSAHISPESSW